MASKDIEIPAIGSTWRYDGYKYHVVAIVNDGDEVLIVVKYFGKRRQWWHYEVWDTFIYWVRIIEPAERMLKEQGFEQV